MTIALAEQTTISTSPAPRPPVLLRVETHSPSKAEPFAIDSGIEDARSLVERHPKHAVHLARLAHAALAAGERDEARSSAISALQLPGDESAHISSALVLVALGESESAEEALRSCSSPAGQYLYAAIAVDRSEFDKARARIRDVDMPLARALEGWLYLQTRDYPTAIRMFRRALEASQPIPEVLINLAYAYGALGERRKALRTAIEATRVAPINPIASRNLVAFYTGCRRFDSARRELRRIEDIYPNSLDILAQKASLEFVAGNHTRFGQILKGLRHTMAWWSATDQDRASIQRLRVAYGLEFEKLTPSKARLELRSALEVQDFRDLPTALLYLSLLSDTSQAPEADSVLSSLAKVHPKSSLTGAKMYRALLNEQYDVAADHARNWIKEDPFDLVALITGTYLLDSVRHYEESLRFVRAFLRRIDARTQVANNLAYPLVCLGRFDVARAALEEGDQANNPSLIATGALIEMYEGNIERGVRGYDHAVDVARKRYATSEFAALLAVKKELVLLEIGASQPKKALVVDPLIANDVRFKLMLIEHDRRPNRS